jgi:feruloyl esterase
MHRVGVLGGLALMALVACASGDGTQVGRADAAMPTSGGVCADLAKIALANTAITTAETVAAGAFRPPQAAGPGPAMAYGGLPEFCRVAGSIKPTADSDIRFEVWMPIQGWNGKFLGAGNGGASGAIVHASLAQGLARGYAVASTDTGHQGGPADYSFAVGHPEKLTDNAWRAVREMTMKGKAIVKAYYSAGPRLSYWNACSTGGRQGLKEAQRFPEDYDGIIAGAPARAFPQLQGFSVLVQQAMTDPVNGLPAAKLSMLKEAAINACDAADGVTDRVVNEPAKCRFDPAVVQCTAGDAPTCLTATQVTAARRLYDGVRDPKDGSLIFSGSNPGGEPAWAGLGSGFSIGESYFRDVVHGGDKNWTLAKYDMAADFALARKVDPTMDASTPDIGAFTRRGGKLILWHGLTDGLIPSQSTVDYYASLAKKDAKATAGSVRMFLMPGVDHCRGGEGPSDADYLTALEQWVEHGKAPETLVASKPLPGGAKRTRPLCAYPNVAKYSGTGSTDDAANFACVAP